MGYESRVIVVNVNRHENYIYGEKIADIKMSKMGDFKKIFTKPIDYKLFITNEDEDTDKDCYGDRLCSADIKTVVEWLETVPKNEGWDDYRRIKPLIGLLNGFNEDNWNELQVVHYGY